MLLNENELRHCALYVFAYLTTGLLLLYEDVYVLGVTDIKFQRAPDVAFEIGAYVVLFLAIAAGAVFCAMLFGMKRTGVVRKRKVRFLSLYLGPLAPAVLYLVTPVDLSDSVYLGLVAVMPAVASLVDYKYGA